MYSGKRNLEVSDESEHGAHVTRSHSEVQPDYSDSFDP